MSPRIHIYGLPMLTGVFAGLSFPAVHWHWLAWVALAPLLLATAHCGMRACAVRFFFSGAVFYAILLHWLLANVYWGGGWAFWGYALLSAFMASYWAGLGAVWAWMRRGLPRAVHAPALAVLWAAMEHLQSFLFTGFGWGALGYTQGANLAVLQLAAAGGVLALSFLIVLVNALLAEGALRLCGTRGPAGWSAVRTPGACSPPPHADPSAFDRGAENRPRSQLSLRGVWRPFGSAAVVLALAHGAGALLLAGADYGDMPFTVGLVQTHFPQEMKWDREYTYEMLRNAAEKSEILAQHHDLSLLVWPEAVVMPPFDSPQANAMLTRLARALNAPLLTGATRLGAAADASYNSSALFNDRGEIAGHYDKIHLAPFGEYVPFGEYLPILRQFVPAFGDLLPGDTPKVFDVNGKRAGPLICFEVLFAPMIERLRRDGAEVIVVMTNLGWFGASTAIPQELELARMRAVEARLPLIHSANTGISGVFDPYGRFQPINGYVDPAGRYREYTDGVAPRHTIMRRMAGALRVARPGPRPIPHGPPAFPWMMLALSGLLAGWRILRGADSSGARHAGREAVGRG